MFSFIDSIPFNQIPFDSKEKAKITQINPINHHGFGLGLGEVSAILDTFGKASHGATENVMLSQVTNGANIYSQFKAIFYSSPNDTESHSCHHQRLLRCNALHKEIPANKNTVISSVKSEFYLEGNGVWTQVVTVRHRNWCRIQQVKHDLLVGSLSEFYRTDAYPPNPDMKLISKLAEVIIRCETWFNIEVHTALSHKRGVVTRLTQIAFSAADKLNMCDLATTHGEDVEFAYSVLIKLVFEFHESITAFLGKNIDNVTFTGNTLTRISGF